MATEELRFLLDLVGGDRATALDILKMFLESDVKDRAELSAAVAAQNTDGIRLHAHRIKGASRAIGANSYAARAQVIEGGSTTGPEVNAALRDLEESARAVEAWAMELQAQ